MIQTGVLIKHYIRVHLIYDAPQVVMHITWIRAFIKIYVSLRLMDYMHQNVDYNILSNALDK